MGDEEPGEVMDVNDDTKATPTGVAAKRPTKRTQSDLKKTPPAKKTKSSPVKKPATRATRSKSAVKKPEEAQEAAAGEEETHTNGDTPAAAVISDPPHNDETKKSNKSAAQRKEEKRKAIQAARIQREKELAALLAQEQALLEDDSEAEEGATEDEEGGEGEPQQSESVEVLTTSTADGYDTRSEVDGSQDDADNMYKRHISLADEDQFESLEDEHNDTAESETAEHPEQNDVDDNHTDGHQDYEDESHEPPVEAGLAGLDDEEEDYPEDEIPPGTGTGRAISPVTWDVDVHAKDEDNLSDDSPLPSDDEISDDEHKDEDDREGATEDKTTAAEADQEETTKPEDNIEPGKKTTEIKPLMSVATEKPSVRASAASRIGEGQADRNSNTSIDAAEALRPRVHKYLYREAKYFMVKSNNHENVRLAKAKGVWSTPPQNEIRFNKAIAENTTVILIFSVRESGSFQGFARVNGSSIKDGPKINWVLPPGISAKALSGVFKLDWISRTDLNFNKTMQLRNPWNMNKPVKIARDGQEVQPSVGESLCKLFTLDGSSDYERVISRVKRKREALQAKGGPINKATRPVNPHPRDNHHHRDNYRDEGRNGRGRGGHRGGYRGGSRGGGGYRNGPTHSYSSSRGPPSNRYPPPHSNHSNYPPSYRTNASSYGDYRNSRNDYPPPVHHAASYQPMPPPYSSGPPMGADMFVKGTYEEYVDSMKRAGQYPPDMGGTMSMYDVYTPAYGSGRDAPPPPPIPSYSSSSRDRDRDRDRPSNSGGRPSADRYDRAVEDFLRRTTGNSRSSRPDRYRDSREYRGRSRSRSRERDRRERR